MTDTVLSILVLGAIVALGGAVFAWRRGARRQAVLLLILAGVIAANVALWLVPLADGTTPANAPLR